MPQYPAAIPSIPGDGSWTHGQVADEVESVMSTLGTNPQGTHLTVRARVEAAETAISSKSNTGHTHTVPSLAINDLTDVDTATVPPTAGQALVYDGTQWEPGSVSGSVDPDTMVHEGAWVASGVQHEFATNGAITAADTGQAVTTLIGSWSQSGGEVVHSNAAGDHITVWDGASRDQVVEIDFGEVPASGTWYVGALARVINATTYLMAEFMRTSGGDLKIAIYVRTTSGGYVEKAFSTTSTGLAAGAFHTGQLRCSGTAVSLWLDGVQKLSTTLTAGEDTSLTSSGDTRIGIFGQQGGAAVPIQRLSATPGTASTYARGSVVERSGSTWVALTATATEPVAASADWERIGLTATPTHAASHASGGTDPVTPAAIGAATSGHTHPALAINDLTDVDTVAVAPATGQALIFDGAQWEPGAVSAPGHIHDDRYFTETEVNNALAGKSDTGHTHAITKRQTFPFSATGTLAVAAGTHRLHNDTGATLTITSVRATVGTAPTGADLIVDLNLDGSTIFTTQSNRPTIAAGTSTDLANAINVTAWPSGSYLSVDIDQVGSTVAGSDLTVTVVAEQ